MMRLMSLSRRPARGQNQPQRPLPSVPRPPAAGYIFEYDIFGDPSQDVSLHVEDTNMLGHQYSQDHDGGYLRQSLY